VAVQPVDLADLEDGDHPKRAIAAEVLVVGQDDWAIHDATSQLRTAGRTVHRCSESTESPFPCNALIPGRGCPLDRNHVDVVLNIRTRPEAQPTLAEMGAICGLRDGIPLVVAGLSEMSGFSAWAERVPPAGDIVSTCDGVVQEAD
jgi:hypothetical protein